MGNKLFSIKYKSIVENKSINSEKEALANRVNDIDSLKKYLSLYNILTCLQHDDKNIISYKYNNRTFNFNVNCKIKTVDNVYVNNVFRVETAIPIDVIRYLENNLLIASNTYDGENNNMTNIRLNKWKVEPNEEFIKFSSCIKSNLYDIETNEELKFNYFYPLFNIGEEKYIDVICNFDAYYQLTPKGYKLMLLINSTKCSRDVYTKMMDVYKKDIVYNKIKFTEIKSFSLLSTAIGIIRIDMNEFSGSKSFSISPYNIKCKISVLPESKRILIYMDDIIIRMYLKLLDYNIEIMKSVVRDKKRDMIALSVGLDKDVNIYIDDKHTSMDLFYTKNISYETAHVDCNFTYNIYTNIFKLNLSNVVINNNIAG